MKALEGGGSNEAGPHSVEDDADDNKLPGDEATWAAGSVGPPNKWPRVLQAHATTIRCIDDPAALLYGEELVFIFNERWNQVSGTTEQGQAQRPRYPPDTLDILDDIRRKGKARGVSSRLILCLSDEDTTTSNEYTALVSPLFSPSKHVHALLVQLLPARESVPLDPQLFFHRFAELLPSGLAILDHKARAVFVNKQFWELTTHYDDDKSFKGWPHSIHPDDYDRVIDAYNLAFTSQQQLRTEFRAQGQTNPWRLLLLTPLGDEDLQHVSLRAYGGFICSIVDITAEKSAAIAERKSAADARERKEQLTAFFDTISHEIRNPMSAVVHSTEDIEEAIQNPAAPDLPAIKEAAEIIEHCVSHMKSIVDDVLSVSKLDSAMLSLVPKPCNPSRQLATTLKMFHSEFRKQDIRFAYHVGASCRAEKGGRSLEIMCDPARIGQILINLTTNAIKFTRNQPHRQITVDVDVTPSLPTDFPNGLVHFDHATPSPIDATSTSPDWGDGEILYLLVAVTDTGIGISSAGQSKLFERFQQATPKTEEIYGGSGLGLNISRKLCELHGGEIGVESTEGKGSTIAFFVKTRRVVRPPNEKSEEETGSAKDADGVVGIEAQLRSLGHAVPDDINPMDVAGSLQTAAKNDEGELAATVEVREPVAEPNACSNPPPDADTASPLLPGIGSSDRPTARPAAVPSRSSTDTSRAPPAPPSSDEQPQPIRILLVEDNVINQRLVHRKLTSKGFAVTTANNGRGAVEAVTNSSSSSPAAFDLVLMDQEMPILNGNAAARQIREYEQENDGGDGRPRVKILGVTANVRDAQQDAMRDCGMDDVISKPYRIDELVARIREMVGR